MSGLQKSTKILGFQSGHDVSYCILENGIPILCEELERFTRVKWQRGDGLELFFGRQNPERDIKYFTFGSWGNRNEPDLKNEACDKQMKKIINKNDGAYYEFGHHTSHAANAFFTSNFREALIITMDGGGLENDGADTAFTISRGIDNKIERILTVPENELNLGTIWNLSTSDVFGLPSGFPNGDQSGTVMAMASLGRPTYTSLFGSYHKNIKKLKKIATISEQEKFNVAASLQEYTEKAFVKTVSKYIKGYKYLCLSGGVSLNCVLTGKIKKWFPEITDIFCDPVPYDAGTSLGSARYLWHQVLENPRIYNNIKNTSPYLGKSYSKIEIENAFRFYKKQIKIRKTTDDMVLKKINNQKIVAVYGGGSETGRRALGNRSILADPRNKDMKEIINTKVKHRQWFRPLAPSILEEKVGDWFEENIFSPYMSFAIKLKSDKKDIVPGVVHFDGTARLQTVNKELSPWFHNFLTGWEGLTGVPILINTSFNDNEPIVESPEDAIKCFLKTKIDFLYFFDYGILIEKK